MQCQDLLQNTSDAKLKTVCSCCMSCHRILFKDITRMNTCCLLMIGFNYAMLGSLAKYLGYVFEVIP